MLNSKGAGGSGSAAAGAGAAAAAAGCCCCWVPATVDVTYSASSPGAVSCSTRMPSGCAPLTGCHLRRGGERDRAYQPRARTAPHAAALGTCCSSLQPAPQPARVRRAARPAHLLPARKDTWRAWPGTTRQGLLRA